MSMKEQLAHASLMENIILNERKELLHDVNYQIEDLEQWKKRRKQDEERFRAEEEKVDTQFEEEMERKYMSRYDDLDLEQKIYEEHLNRYGKQMDFVDQWKQKKENNLKAMAQQQLHSQINDYMHYKEG